MSLKLYIVSNKLKNNPSKNQLQPARNKAANGSVACSTQIGCKLLTNCSPEADFPINVHGKNPT